MAQPETATVPDCSRCRRGQYEVYLYLDRAYEFDVDRARALVEDGREPVEVDDDSVRASVRHSEIDERHVDHVDTRHPGIIAHVFYRTAEGDEVQAHLLIDGNHRAARCLKDDRPFFAYLLTEEESRAITVRSPDRPGGLHGPDTPEASDLHAATTQAYQEKFAASRPLAYRAQWVIGGAATHDRRGFGPFGVYVARAEGPRKWDVAGQPLIDLWMGHGALLMGHGFAPVVEAVQRQMGLGSHYGAGHALEVDWSELVRDLVPSARRIRFTSSGTEATLLALRIARAYTGRPAVVLKFDGHFHGWHDEAMSHFYPTQEAGFNAAALTQVQLAHPTDPGPAVERMARGDVAAVILEPGGGSSGGLPWSREFLQALRAAATRYHTVLIFDEVVSGFRHGVGGVQQVTGVIPDLTTLAKILAGGLPGGAVAGRTDVMAVLGEGTRLGGRTARVPHTGTFNANPLSAAAGITLLQHVADGVAQAKARHAAERLAAGINRAAEQHGVDVFSYTNDTSIYHLLIGARRAGAALGPSHAIAHLHRERPAHYALLRRALLVEGVDTHPVHGWISATHDDATIDEAVAAFGRAFVRLRGVEGLAREG